MSRILVVDDVASHQDLVCRALQDAGYTVSHAHSGDKVMQNIELNKPNLIVLDVVMECMGYEVLWELRENEKTRQIPVVVISAKNTDFDKAWSMELGADAYVAKPIDAEYVVSIVQQLLETQLMQPETTISPEADSALFFDMLDEILGTEESIGSPI